MNTGRKDTGEKSAQSGDWQGLDDVVQHPRYVAILQMLQQAGAANNVLDVGCGEALLRNWLPDGSEYFGIEPSPAAVRSALRRDPNAQVVCTSAESFHSSDQRFQAVVFNEMLYYSRDPLRLLSKYAALLRPDGIMLFSVYQKPGQISFRSRIRHLFSPAHPVSNIRCERMIRNYTERKRWPTVDDRIVNIPLSDLTWHIWITKPSSDN